MTDTTIGPDMLERAIAVIREMAPGGAVEGGRELDLAADLGFDSLAVLEVLVALEDELGLSVLGHRPPPFMTTLGDVEDYLRGVLAQNTQR